MADEIEATARRTGFVQRTSTLTGQLLLALVTCGAWSDAQTTLAPWAAQAAQWGQPVDISPEALPPRMQKKALALLQDMMQQAWANRQSLDHGWDDGLVPALTNVSMAESTGCALPDALHKTCPGAGGRAAKAGAKLQAVGDYTSSLLGHVALTPGHIPAQRSVETVVALAQKGVWFRCEVGYVTVNALAQMVTAGAYVGCRRHHQTNRDETVAGRVCPVKLAEFLATVEPGLLLREKASRLGATEHVAARLMAVRMPEAVVKARRRSARKHAKPTGDTPSQAHLTLMAWNRLMAHVPPTIGQTATVRQVSPRRWHIELMVKSWKS
jgi:hypothetical protein